MDREAQTKPCPVCGGNGRRLRKFAEKEREVLSLFSCERCFSEFLFPQPSAAWLNTEYENYYSKKRHSVADHPKRPYFSGLLSMLNINFSHKKVLDIGAAEGDLIIELKRLWASADAYAVDVHPDTAAYFSNCDCTYYNADILEWLGRQSNPRFDCVFILDVLEHLPDPTGAIQALTGNCLKPGGTVVGTFPAVTSPSRKILSRLWPQYKVEHLAYFSERGVRQLEKAGNLKRACLVPLKKSLPLNYLLKVGGQVGPRPVKQCCRAIAGLVPRALGNLRFGLRLGEYLWIAEKK